MYVRLVNQNKTRQKRIARRIFLSRTHTNKKQNHSHIKTNKRSASLEQTDMETQRQRNVEKETRGPSPRKKRRRNALCQAMVSPKMKLFLDEIQASKAAVCSHAPDAPHAQKSLRPSDFNIVQQNVQKSLRSWDFDIFEFLSDVRHVVSQDEILPLVSSLIFNDMSDELASIGVNRKCLNNYMQSINKQYLKNPFHNSLHGADVGQTVYSLLCSGTWHRTLAAVDKFALVVAAFSHDVGHNGENNQFLVQSGSILALRDGEESVLEKMHLRISWDTLELENCNFLKTMSLSNKRRFAHVFKISILGTDNAKHFEKLNALKALVESKRNGEGETTGSVKVCGDRHDEDLDLILELVVHAADISNPTKAYVDGPYKIWCANIMEEFYALGDKERDLGLSVTDIFRREKSVQEVQTGFTKFFVRPLFVALGDIEGFDMQRPLDRIEENLAYWDSTTSSKK